MPAAPARPVREQPVAEDAPLAVAAPAAAPKSAAALATAERDAPAVALAPSAGAHAATVAEIGAVTDVTSRSAAPARGEELTASAGAGQETAAHVTQPDATTRPAGPGGGDAPDKALDAGPGAPARIAETGHAPLGQGGAESAQPRGGSVLGSPLPSRDGPGGGLAAGDRGAAAPTPGGTELGAFAGLQRDAAPIAGGAGTSTNAGARTASNIGGDAPLPAGSLGGAPVAVTPTQGGGTGNTAPSTARGGTALGTGVVASGAGTELALATGRDGGVGPGQASPLPRAGVGAERGVASAGTGTTPRRSPGTSALAGDQPLAAGSSPAVVGTRPTAGGVEQAPVRGGTALGSGVPGAGTAIALTGALTPGAGQGPYAAANLPRAQVGTGNAPRSGTSTATRRADGGVGTAGDGPLAAGAAPAVTAARGPGTAPGAGLADKGRAVAVPGTGLPGRLNPASVSTGLGQGYRPPPSEQKAAQPLNPAPSSTLLEAQRGQAVAAAPQSYVMPAQRLFNSAATGASLRLDLGLARHSGDWNSSPTALQYLRTAFLERAALPELEVNVATLNLSDLKAMLKCRVILITSNKPIAFTAAELATMREYIRLGGTLWVNDSSASDDETCDQSLRPALPQLVPGGELRTLPLEHPFFAVCYDLRKGFKEFRVPPGDKYRCDYLEAVFVPDAAGAVDEKSSRAGVIYTRNDYADGLVIDPRMNAGMKSLTDLTNAEMLESSLRFGMNLLAYSMGADAARLPPPPESAAEYEKMYRYKGPPLPVLDDYTVTLDQWQKPVWVAEQEWCNPTELRFLDDDALKSKAVALDFKGGQKFKAAATRFGQVDLSNSNALVFDLHSSVGRGCNVALLLVSKDGPSYESRPVFVRPGWNRNLRFPLDKGDMKSSASKEPWKEYDTPFEPRNAIERITILIYNLTDSGSVKIGPLRLQGQ
jgi:hypothetical protein